jgi:zinc transport system permease protein
MDDFIWRAVLGAAVLGAACGPVGCFVLWRRMAYLGESVAHVGLLGAAIGILIGIAPIAGVAALAVAAALVMARVSDSAGGLIPSGTIIGIVGHVGLALGFVLLSTMETVRTDLLGYLFGDVLALSTRDIIAVAGVSLAVLASMIVLWRPLLALAVNRDIAAAEGLSARWHELAFLVVVAGLVAFGLKIVGALLIVALLLIPPAAARPFARTPEMMAVLATIFGALASPAGIAFAYWKDIPAGPAIVLAAALFFALSTIAAHVLPARRRTA